jgi:hypothetical protein
VITTRKTQARVDAMCLTEDCRAFHVGDGSDAWAVDHVKAEPDHLVSVTRLTVDLHYCKGDDDGA